MSHVNDAVSVARNININSAAVDPWDTFHLQVWPSLPR